MPYPTAARLGTSPAGHASRLKVVARAPPESLGPSVAPAPASMADLLSPTLHERPLTLLEDALGLLPRRSCLDSLSTFFFELDSLSANNSQLANSSYLIQNC